MIKTFNPSTDELEMRKFGKEHEDIEYIYLSNIYNNLKKSKERFSIFDFYNDEYLIELKTRTNTHNQYPTTMISMNKLEYKDKRKKVFYFKFLDGLYRWNMDTPYKEGTFKGRRYAYVDINNLIKI